MATPIVYSRIVTHPCPCLPATPGISSIASTPSPTLQDSTPISSTPSPTLQDSAPISSTSSPTLEDSAPPSSTPSPTLTPPLPLETTTTVTVPGRPTWASWKYVLSIAAVLIAVVVVAVFLLPGMFDKQQAPIIALPPPTIPVTGPTPTTPTMIVGDDKVTLATVQPGQQVPCRTAIRGMYTPDVTDAIWPVIYVNGLYHPADTPQGSGKPAQKTNGTWESVVQFGDCTLSRGDRFELLIVIADRSANAAFENYLAETRKTQSFPGMLLPDGADIRLRVEVVRQ